MTTTVGTPTRGWPPLRDWLPRLWRRASIKAFLGAQFVAAAIILLRMQGWLQPLELIAYDELRVAWAGHATGKRLLIVAVTENEINELKDGWPLRDRDFAALLERLESWQPRVIGIDIYHNYPRPREDAIGTQRFDEALRRYPNILWVFKLGDGADSGVPPPQQLQGSDRAVLSDVVQDPDGIVRRGLLYAGDGRSEYETLGMALARHYLWHYRIAPGAGPTPGSLRLGKAVVDPLDDARGPYLRVDSSGFQTLLDFHGGPQPFPIRDYREIMASDRDAPLVHGRAIIIASAAESVEKKLYTPFNTGFGDAPRIWGFDIHAQIADQLIRQALYGTRALSGWPRPVEDLWIWAWAMAGAALGLGIRLTTPAIIASGAGLGGLAGIVYAAFGMGLLLPVVPAAGAWLAAAALTNQVLHAASNRARARLRRSFEHYLPPAVIAQMVEADALPELGGERREFSVVFSDVADFTTLSETIDPADLAPLTNEYFAGVGAAIFAEAGYINEFMGDGVLAFFGAPQPQADHADRAVAAALGIAAFGERFSAEQRARGVGFRHTRVGVHCGVAMVGNVGTPSRLKYSAQGDMLNTGSRLEGLNKAIGTRICCSEAIVRQSQRHRFRPIGDFVVKGRHHPIRIFEPLDGERYPAAHIARYEAAFAALAAGSAAAAQIFAELHREAPDDPCVAFHHHRLEAGQTGTLIVMTEK
ncbi:MAG TPA: adenylate/guanylate cyclase domain-containing protein [Stellaceae bacterium]|nr:adenylate/guanylate cyclase domain-containing protein [Stellaceae bacterium]